MYHRNMHRHRIKLSCYLGLLSCLTLSQSVCLGEPIVWEFSEGGNGHSYESFLLPENTPWSVAKSFAEFQGGHLATLTNQAELDWVFDHIASDPDLWFTDSFNFLAGPYLGAFQNTSSPDYTEPDGGWEWVTGEEWNFTSWASGQPNDVGSQGALHFWSRMSAGIAPTWQDINNDGGLNSPRSMIVEYVPAPGTLVFSLAGLLCATHRIRD